MSRGNKKKAEQLGMPFGTACYRLRKAILFHLIRVTGLNGCYRCGEIIESVDDLSIEHKAPWLDSDDPVELFFNLDNIAFSHLSCNCAEKKRNGSQAKKGPVGMAWCSGCQGFLPESDFGKNPQEKRKRELRYYCNTCRKEKRNWGHS